MATSLFALSQTEMALRRESHFRLRKKTSKRAEKLFHDKVYLNSISISLCPSTTSPVALACSSS